MPDLVYEERLPKTWGAETIIAGHPQRMPNPDRKLAEGDPLYTSFIDVFGDDVSGNQSKSWNKHWNIYITHRNLPWELLQHSYNIHFVSTSTHASVPEQFQSIREVIRFVISMRHNQCSTHTIFHRSTCDQPVRVKQTSGRQIRFKLRCNCAPGDNPSQSEVCAHIGGNGNFPCRKCHIGGNQEWKKTDEGFSEFFQVRIAPICYNGHKFKNNFRQEYSAQGWRHSKH